MTGRMMTGMSTPDAESAHMDEVNRHPTGPTESDEMEVLNSLYEYDEETGTFKSFVGDDD